eukprot:520470-Prorocentrum_minimum.AAC.1
MVAGELAKERLLLALVNGDTNKLLGKAALPTKPLAPGRHYNVKLLMDKGGAEGGQMAMYITLKLTQNPAYDIAHA